MGSKSKSFWPTADVTFTTGVAGRATVLTEEVELLFGVRAGEAGGMTAAFPLLLAPFAPLAAPAGTRIVNVKPGGVAAGEGNPALQRGQSGVPFLASMYLP